MKKYNWKLAGILAWYYIFGGIIFTLFTTNIANNNHTGIIVWGFFILLTIFNMVNKLNKLVK
jgi:hypothetical protein